MRILLPCLLLLLGACTAAGSGSTAASADDPQAQLLAEAAEHGIYPEEAPVRVTFYDHKSGNKIGLYNEAAVDRSKYYSKVRRSAEYKVVSNLDMGALMKQLEDFGFFQAANHSSDRVPGARTTVQVERNGQVYTLAYVVGDDLDRRQLVLDSALAVQAIYNTNQSFQIIENEKGPAYFKQGAQVPRPGGN